MSRSVSNAGSELIPCGSLHPSGMDEDGSTQIWGTSQVTLPQRELSTAHRNRDDLLRARDLVWESLANKTLPPEESELIMRRLERRADARTRRTYIGGNPTSSVLESAPTVLVGLSFLPGADKAQVARFEQGVLSDARPDQKNAMWRVNTAGTLLKKFEVLSDLSLKEEDMTSIFSQRARMRQQSRNSPTSPSLSSPMQQLSLSHRDHDAVTIDSQRVRIVDNLEAEQYDLQATLVEVDGVSLISLMINYRYLISRTGANMTFDENRTLLDIMIEDARRLCVRSPALFRMSTRCHIIKSKNTRYGIDQSDQFRTISTSQGIKEIISISAAYFNALDPEGSNDVNQRFIRPRFLQMLVLLLLFLNDDDLKDISRFLETTYRIKADRPHIEILILKVIPLMSINPTIFLEALIPAVEGFPLKNPVAERIQPTHWDTFIQRILHLGYILPGGIESLGRSQNSWIMKWPDQGFKSTKVFQHLQYAGDKLRTINDIMPVDLHPEDHFPQLTVNLLDGREYVLDSRDIERITTMSTGQYSIAEAGVNGRKLELEIVETHISEQLELAIGKVNQIIDDYNRIVATPRRRLRLGGRTGAMPFLNNVESCGRMTKHNALLDQDMMTSAYKVEGRKITRNDAWRKMAWHDRQLDHLLSYLERQSSDLESNNFQLGEALQSARNMLRRAQDDRRRIGYEKDFSDEPIASVLYPSPEAMGLQPLWHNYKASYSWDEQLLHLNAKIAPVVGVQWQQKDVVEVTLQGHTAKYFAKPLNEDAFDQEDEIRVGDHAALVGQYLMIAEASDQGPSRLIATNYMRITGLEETVRTRRGANRAFRVEESQESMFL